MAQIPELSKCPKCDTWFRSFKTDKFMKHIEKHEEDQINNSELNCLKDKYKSFKNFITGAVSEVASQNVSPNRIQNLIKKLRAFIPDCDEWKKGVLFC